MSSDCRLLPITVRISAFGRAIPLPFDHNNGKRAGFSHAKRHFQIVTPSLGFWNFADFLLRTPLCRCHGRQVRQNPGLPGRISSPRCVRLARPDERTRWDALMDQLPITVRIWTRHLPFTITTKRAGFSHAKLTPDCDAFTGVLEFPDFLLRYAGVMDVRSDKIPGSPDGFHLRDVCALLVLMSAHAGTR